MFFTAGPIINAMERAIDKSCESQQLQSDDGVEDKDVACKYVKEVYC